MLDRPHLYDQLDKGALGLLTVVSGPAGTGKTDLLISWLNQLESPAAVRWIAGAAPFWSEMEAAIGTPSVRAVVENDRPVTVVLDDFPGATPQLASDLLALARNTTNLRVIIVGRRSLSTEFLGLRLAGQLYEIDATQLAFDVEEIRRLAAL
ncbi:MAG TPA: hypothetical protein VHC49_05965, partial [Mycobacteriales bacterium]|nr:hypothetical protein [Mycobacteriales bacterium]